MALAAPGDTWGISGPSFLALYFFLIVAVAVLSSVHRRILFRGPSSVNATGLGPQQVAYLNGGDRLAVYTALGGLRAAGAIGSGPGRTLTQTGPLPSGVTPLDRAVHHAAGGHVRARDVGSDQWVVSALDELRTGLERGGYSTTRGQRRAALMWGVAGGAAVLLGIGRLVDGLQNDKPVGFLIPLIFLAGLVTVVMLAKASTTKTKAAGRAVRDLQKRNRHLAPSQQPAYATYGATGAAMGVALFGAGALFAMDPAFAAEAEIQRAAATGAGSSAPGGCGGGSSDSSGSGSSSCGGGSGCGGGGCGG